MPVDDGGSAYPSEQGHIPDGTWNQTYSPGMSLRVWLASKAQACIYIEGEGVVTFREATIMENVWDGYRIADQIIAWQDKSLDEMHDEMREAERKRRDEGDASAS